MEDMCKLIQKPMKWVYDNINPKARLTLNLRDLLSAMPTVPERVLKVVEFLSKMLEDKRLFALLIEDPASECMPDEMAAYIKAVRGTMVGSGWTNGHLLNHIHEKWEMKTANTLECLAVGSNGVWAGLCVEGGYGTRQLNCYAHEHGSTW